MLLGLNSFMDGFSFWSGEWGVVTSKGSYRSWKKIVKVWMMMKEGIFAGHPSLALPPRAKTAKRELKRQNAS